MSLLIFFSFYFLIFGSGTLRTKILDPLERLFFQAHVEASRSGKM